jgi:DNA-binding MarR family transcriptional regulator
MALREGSITIGELVKELGITKQGAGQLVDALVMRGYLSRSVDESDRRQLIVDLTERGHAAADVQREVRERIDAELQKRIGEEDVRAARRALGTLIKMQREEVETAA